MNSYWDGYKIRRILKKWFSLTKHLNQLSLNNLVYLQQIYYRLSYLNLKDQKYLAINFYFHKIPRPIMNHQRKLMKIPRKAPNQSLNPIKVIQLKRLANAFNSSFSILKPKVTPDLMNLNQVCDEDFATKKVWSATKCENQLRKWYSACHNSSVSPQTAITVRQLIYRMSYLLPVEKKILREYYYHSGNKFPRSQFLAKKLRIDLESLLIIKNRAIGKLRSPRNHPKIKLNLDEKWQLKSNQTEIREIIKNVFLANF